MEVESSNDQDRLAEERDRAPLLSDDVWPRRSIVGPRGETTGPGPRRALERTAAPQDTSLAHPLDDQVRCGDCAASLGVVSEVAFDLDPGTRR